MPPLRLGEIDPALQNAFRPLKRGQVSGIIKTASGYELIRKETDMEQKTLIPLEAAAEVIRVRLKLQRLPINNQMATSKLTITIDSAAIEAANLPVPSP